MDVVLFEIRNGNNLAISDYKIGNYILKVTAENGQVHSEAIQKK